MTRRISGFYAGVASILMLLGFFSINVRADEVGTVFETNGFVCSSSDSGYYSGSAGISWKNLIISTYKSWSTNMGRCPDLGGYIYWQNDITSRNLTEAEFADTWLNSANTHQAALGGVANYQQMFHDACLSAAVSRYGSWVIGAKYVPYSGNMCQITLVKPNYAPSVSNATLTTDEDTTGYLNLIASDPNAGDTHTFQIVSAPANGSASISGNRVTYTPSKDWNGSTSLTYRAIDQRGGVSAVATISVIVNPVNDAPVADAKTLDQLEDTVGIVTLSATDIDSPAPTVFKIVSPPSVGSAEISGSKLSYTPQKDWNGSTRLTYMAQDSDGAWSAPADLSITVNWVNDAPAATGGAIVTKEGMSSDHIKPWVVDVDTIYGDTHTFSVAEQPKFGYAKFVGDFLEYTPKFAYFGNDVIRIKATDREGLSVIGDVTVEVLKFNYKPTGISPKQVDVYAGIGGTVKISVDDPNTWGSHTLVVVKQPEHGEITVDGLSLVYKTDGDKDSTVLVRAIDQDGFIIEQEIQLHFVPAWEMFKNRPVEKTTASPSIPAVKKQMTTRSRLYAFQIPDAKMIEELGTEIVAIVTPDSKVGVTLQHRELSQGIGMRLVPTKRTAELLEARLGGLNVGVDGESMIYVSRADMTGPVYSVPVRVWAPTGSLTSDSWEILQAVGRTQIGFTSSNDACTFLTNESAARPKNAIQDRTCFVTWTQTPNEWRDTSLMTKLSMDATGGEIGQNIVQATAYVFDQDGVKYEISNFSNALKVLSADQVKFGLKPDITEAYQKVQDLSLLAIKTEGPICDPTANEANAKRMAQLWSVRPVCLIRWMQLPEGLSQPSNTSSAYIQGAMALLGLNEISWKASVFTPSGKEIDLSYGEHSVNVILPEAPEVTMPTDNLVKEGMYAVSQLGGYVGSIFTTAIEASLDAVIERGDKQIEKSTIPSYGRSQRFTRSIEGTESLLWSFTPFSIDVGYTALPAVHTKKEVVLLSVPHEKILPVILNDERTVLDTVSLPIDVAIKDTRYMEDAYNVSKMGDWDIRLLSTTTGLNYEPMTDWEPIDGEGKAQFEIELSALTNKAVRIIAEARVRSPVPEYELFRRSNSPLVISVLNGDALDGLIQALRIIGPAPLRSTFYAVTKNRYQTGDLGDVRWEMSKDHGVTWETLPGNPNLPQRLSMVFPRGSYLLRAELTNRHSGAKSMTPTIEVIAYVVPAARLKGPANVFIGDTGNFTLTDIKGVTLDTSGMVVEWSEDRGKTWVVGEGTYRLTRDKAARVYLTARLKYTDSPDDKRVYKTLRAGVAFRPVRPPRVQIIGPRRPEVGKEATWVANLMMPYPKMDMTMDGEFILPDGTVVHANDVKYTPTQEDMDKEESYISVRSWINGYEEKGGLGITQHRLIFWFYAWPDWTLKNKMTAKYSPADLTMTARALGIFREFENLKIEWDIPPYDGLEIVKDSLQTSRILRITEPGKYKFGAHITDGRGNYSYAETELEFLVPIPWDIQLSWSGDNAANRAPLGVLIRPTITGGHPKDKIESKIYSLNGQKLPSSGDYGRAELKEEGVHTINLDISTMMGYTATGAVNIPVETNKSPTCTLEVALGRSSWLAKANCADEDGRMAKNIWFINGVQQALSSNNISVPMWRYPDGEPVITLVGVDDSGAESEPTSNK